MRREYGSMRCLADGALPRRLAEGTSGRGCALRRVRLVGRRVRVAEGVPPAPHKRRRTRLGSLRKDVSFLGGVRSPEMKRRVKRLTATDAMRQARASPARTPARSMMKDGGADSGTTTCRWGKRLQSECDHRPKGSVNFHELAHHFAAYLRGLDQRHPRRVQHVCHGARPRGDPRDHEARPRLGPGHGHGCHDARQNPQSHGCRLRGPHEASGCLAVSHT